MVRRNDSAVICLEEVGATRAKAVRRFGEAVGRSSAQMLEGFARLPEVMRAAAAAMASLHRAEGPSRRPAAHAFTPDYDLHCSVRGCGLGPEEHDLW